MNENKIKKLPLVLTDDDGIRPAGKPDHCCYCQQKVGDPHKADCVILQRKVKVRYSFEIEIEVPHSWSAHDIEFHRNDSSWCSNNAVDELQENIKEGECLCDAFKCEVLNIPKVAPYRKNSKEEIVD